MDADDISLPQRFEMQIQAFDKNPALALVGSMAQIIDENGDPEIEVVLPTESGIIKWVLISSNCIISSSAMMRRKIVAKCDFFTLGFDFAEDYELWSRIAELEAINNLPYALVKYRVWGDSLTFRIKSQQNTLADKISYHLLKHYVQKNVPQNIALGLRYLRDPKSGLCPENIQQIRETSQLLTDLYNAYTRSVSLTDF